MQVEGKGYRNITIENKEEESENDQEGETDASQPRTRKGIFPFNLFGKKEIVDPAVEMMKQEAAAKAAARAERLVTCPIDYEATVEGATVTFFGNPFELDIAGTATVRVLYADSNMRIFVSPKDDQFEAGGNTVVQVRADLLDPSFQEV